MFYVKLNFFLLVPRNFCDVRLFRENRRETFKDVELNKKKNKANSIRIWSYLSPYKT